MGTLVPLRHLLLQRLVHLGAKATTPAQRPRLRIIQQPDLFQVSKDFVVKVLKQSYIHSVVTWTVVPKPFLTLTTEVSQDLAHGRGIFAFEVVGTNMNTWASDVQVFFCIVSVLGLTKRLVVTSLVPLLDLSAFISDSSIEIVDLASLARHKDLFKTLTRCSSRHPTAEHFVEQVTDGRC